MMRAPLPSTEFPARGHTIRIIKTLGSQSDCGLYAMVYIWNFAQALQEGQRHSSHLFVDMLSIYA